MRWLAGWIRTTFDYNPTFPLSALLLLAGLALGDAELDAATASGTAVGLGVLQGYELLLLGVALLLLWPRRIAYETTAILIVVGVVRFAAPFLVAGHAGGGHPWEAAALGAGLTVLMAAKACAVWRRVGLDLRRWEVGLDAGLYGLAAVGFPLLAGLLPVWTGGRLSHEAARGLQVAAWWGLALLLAPLALGLPDLGRAGPLRSRRTAATWRGMTLVALPLLLGNALWVGGRGPTAFALLPLALTAGAVLGALVRATGSRGPGWLVHLPAATAALVLFLPLDLLHGGDRLLDRGPSLLALLPLAAAALPLLAPGRVRAGLRGLALVVALAPLRLAPTWTGAEVYLLAAATALLAFGLWRRREPLVVHGAAAASLLALHLSWDGTPERASAVLLTAAGVLGLALAVRLPRARLAGAVAAGLFALPWGFTLLRGVDATTALPLAGAAGALALLAARAGRPRLAAAPAAALALALARPLGAQAVVAATGAPGAALILLAFAVVPLGAWVAIRRERLALAPRAPEGPSPERVGVDDLELTPEDLVAFDPDGCPAPAGAARA